MAGPHRFLFVPDSGSAKADCPASGSEQGSEPEPVSGPDWQQIREDKRQSQNLKRPKGDFGCSIGLSLL